MLKKRSKEGNIRFLSEKKSWIEDGFYGLSTEPTEGRIDFEGMIEPLCEQYELSFPNPLIPE